MSNTAIRAMTFGWFAAFLAVCASAQGARIQEGDDGSALPPTAVLSSLDAERLKTTQGITLQWISWEERGTVDITRSDEGHWWLRAEQSGEPEERLVLDGFIQEIGKDYFLFDGRITIKGAPDADRQCDQHKVWRFEATKRRSYYRLREFEWCDYLTDYIDIYFAPGLR